MDNGQGSTYSYDDPTGWWRCLKNELIFAYDGLGNRLVQVFAGVPITYTNDIAGDLSLVLVETTDAGATNYLYGLNWIAQQSPASTDYFLGDGLDLVRQLPDASGHMILVRNCEPFGRVLSTVGRGTTRYDFTGEYKDSGALIYLRARYYWSYLNCRIWRDSIVPHLGVPQH